MSGSWLIWRRSWRKTRRRRRRVRALRPPTAPRPVPAPANPADATNRSPPPRPVKANQVWKANLCWAAWWSHDCVCIIVVVFVDDCSPTLLPPPSRQFSSQTTTLLVWPLEELTELASPSTCAPLRRLSVLVLTEDHAAWESVTEFFWKS